MEFIEVNSKPKQDEQIKLSYYYGFTIKENQFLDCGPWIAVLEHCKLTDTFGLKFLLKDESSDLYKEGTFIQGKYLKDLANELIDSVKK